MSYSLMYCLSTAAQGFGIIVCRDTTVTGTSSVHAMMAGRGVHAGHSLGGALATLAAYDIQSRFGLKDLQVYTFGAPRTGNHAFARCAKTLRNF